MVMWSIRLRSMAGANLTVGFLYVLYVSLSYSVSFSAFSLSLVSLNSSLCFAAALPLNNKARILNLCWVIFMRLFPLLLLLACSGLVWSALSLASSIYAGLCLFLL